MEVFGTRGTHRGYLDGPEDAERDLGGGLFGVALCAASASRYE
jgi:hypothetical protein